MTLGHDASAVSIPGPRDPRREDGLRLAHASRVPLGISRDSDAAAVAPSPQGSLERAKQSWCFHVGLTRRTGVTWFWETQSEAVTVSPDSGAGTLAHVPAPSCLWALGVRGADRDRLWMFLSVTLARYKRPLPDRGAVWAGAPTAARPPPDSAAQAGSCAIRVV